MHSVVAKVDDVRGAATVDVRQPNATLVEPVGKIEPGRIAHGDFGSEPGEPEIRPVTHLAVAYSYQVGQSVSCHVGEVNGLRAVGKHQRGTMLFVESLCHRLCRGKAQLCQTLIPCENLGFCN